MHRSPEMRLVYRLHLRAVQIFRAATAFSGVPLDLHYDLRRVIPYDLSFASDISRP